MTPKTVNTRMKVPMNSAARRWARDVSSSMR
jgi:hypothetical protein